jgi:putative toxin-antitoxin system antitoxin component (TIGR02293 family)
MASAAKTKSEQGSKFRRVLDLLGGTRTFEYYVYNALDAHELIRQGLPAAALTSLCQNVSLFQRSKASFEALGISERTLLRRKSDTVPKTLSREVSDRAWKLAEVVAKATELFGSQEEAEEWLDRPAIGLNQNRPIELMTTTAGSEIVHQYLERMESGVYT